MHDKYISSEESYLEYLDRLDNEILLRSRDRKIKEANQKAEKEKQKAELARQRHQARLERLEREQKEREAKLRQKTPPRPAPTTEVGQLPIEAAVARARPERGAAPVDEPQPSVAITADGAERDG